MLLSLHVKNLALIDEEEIEYKNGLNILSGETGAGKSIILGALGLALGGKIEKGMLRHAEEEALVEAVFFVEDAVAEKISDEDIVVYDNQVILTRRISSVKSVARINGETVPAAKLKEIGELLVDIYGQNDHQLLLKKNRQLKLIDDFAGKDVTRLKDDVATEYKKLTQLKKEYEEENMDESLRLREASFLEHEINEITEANLKLSEDEELESDYRRMAHSQSVSELLSDCYNRLNQNIEDDLGAALRDMSQAAGYDSNVCDMESELADAEAIISNVKREIYRYMEDLNYDPSLLNEIENRLNLINDLKSKYGRTIEVILETLKEKQERLEKLNDHDAYLLSLRKEIDSSEERLNSLCEALTSERKKAAKILSEKTEEALKELNFLDSVFEINLTDTVPNANGKDEAEFMISVNPGEELKPLRNVASGGELSRIMLALKTVAASNDDLGCFIFDEIDAGISGRAALAVAHRLATLAKDVQIICITHLPQIASMADNHFLIEKSVSNGNTISSIHPLSDEERVLELARMLGGEDVSNAAKENARTLIYEADKYKA